MLRPGGAAPALGHRRRAELIAQEGADELVVIAFTHELSVLSPERFVAEVLAGKAGAVRVVVGEDYRFGARAEGDAERCASSAGARLRGRGRAAAAPRASASRRPGSASSSPGRGQPRRAAARPRPVARRLGRARLRPRPRARRPDREPGHDAGPRAPGPASTPAGPRWPGRAPRGRHLGRRQPDLRRREGTVVEAYLLGFEADIYGRPMRCSSPLPAPRAAFETVEDLVARMRLDIGPQGRGRSSPSSELVDPLSVVFAPRSARKCSNCSASVASRTRRLLSPSSSAPSSARVSSSRT